MDEIARLPEMKFGVSPDFEHLLEALLHIGREIHG